MSFNCTRASKNGKCGECHIHIRVHGALWCFVNAHIGALFLSTFPVSPESASKLTLQQRGLIVVGKKKKRKKPTNQEPMGMENYNRQTNQTKQHKKQILWCFSFLCRSIPDPTIGDLASARGDQRLILASSPPRHPPPPSIPGTPQKNSPAGLQILHLPIFSCIFPSETPPHPPPLHTGYPPHFGKSTSGHPTELSTALWIPPPPPRSPRCKGKAPTTAAAGPWLNSYMTDSLLNLAFAVGFSKFWWFSLVSGPKDGISSLLAPLAAVNFVVRPGMAQLREAATDLAKRSNDGTDYHAKYYPREGLFLGSGNGACSSGERDYAVEIWGLFGKLFSQVGVHHAVNFMELYRWRPWREGIMQSNLGDYAIKIRELYSQNWGNCTIQTSFFRGHFELTNQSGQKVVMSDNQGFSMIAFPRPSDDREALTLGMTLHQKGKQHLDNKQHKMARDQSNTNWKHYRRVCLKNGVIEGGNLRIDFCSKTLLFSGCNRVKKIAALISWSSRSRVSVTPMISIWISGGGGGKDLKKLVRHQYYAWRFSRFSSGLWSFCGIFASLRPNCCDKVEIIFTNFGP